MSSYVRNWISYQPSQNRLVRKTSKSVLVDSFMNIIVDLEVTVYELIIGIVKHVIANPTEKARILGSILVIHSHLRRFVDLTDRALLESQLRLKHNQGISSSIMHILFPIYHPHVSYHHHMLAITLSYIRISHMSCM